MYHYCWARVDYGGRISIRATLDERLIYDTGANPVRYLIILVYDCLLVYRYINSIDQCFRIMRELERLELDTNNFWS